MMDASKLRRPQSRVVPGSKHDVVRRNAEQVLQARADGFTWASIAAALGLDVSEAAMRRLAVRTGVIAGAQHAATSERGSKPRAEPARNPGFEPVPKPVREPGSEPDGKPSSGRPAKPVTEPATTNDGAGSHATAAGFGDGDFEPPPGIRDTPLQRRFRAPANVPPRDEMP